MLKVPSALPYRGPAAGRPPVACAAPGAFERSKDQRRYNEYGRRRLQALREHGGRASDPDAYRWRPLVHDDLMAALGPALGGRRLLELGCGVGEFSIFCAQRGAIVTGVDLGPDLVAAAREWSQINQAGCTFVQASAADLPLESRTFDLVVGLAVLHHLCPADLRKAMHEAWRVLVEGGRAVFFEPVQHSAVMTHLRNTLPVQVDSRYGGYRRPSIWNRAQWARYVESLDDRYLTFAELAEAARPFASVRLQARGLLDGLQDVVGARWGPALTRADQWLIRRLPAAAYLCREVIVTCRKGGEIAPAGATR